MGEPLKFAPTAGGLVEGARLWATRMRTRSWMGAAISVAGALASLFFWLMATGSQNASLEPIAQAINGLRAEVVASDAEWQEMLIVAQALGDDSAHKINTRQAVETARVIRRKCQAYGPETGLDEAMVLAVAQRESDGFDPRSKSPTGALGLMQVVGSTYRKHLARAGAADKFTEELAFDPACNVEIGIEELVEQRRAYKAIEGTSWLLTLTAYRWGPGEAQKLITHLAGGQAAASLEYAANVQVRAERWRARLAEARARGKK